MDTTDQRNGQAAEARAAMAETAGGRAVIYQLFVDFFSRLPDQDLLFKILGDDFQKVLDGQDARRPHARQRGQVQDQKARKAEDYIWLQYIAKFQ